MKKLLLISAMTLLQACQADLSVGVILDGDDKSSLHEQKVCGHVAGSVTIFTWDE